MEDMKIKEATACYTGGGCYVYTGKLENGLFFVGSDNWESIVICNANSNIYEEIPEEFWENHTVEELEEEPYKEFFNDMLQWIIDNTPEGNYLACELEDRLFKKEQEIKNIMTVKDLKRILNGLPEDMEVFVACEGYSNWNFKENKPYNDEPTLHEVRDGKLFICDSCVYGN